MSEPGVIRGLKNAFVADRTKSLRQIDQQYSKIENRLYRQYLNFEIDEGTYNNRMNQIKNAYDRYQTNYLRQQAGPNWQRGMDYPKTFDSGRQVPRSVYAKKIVEPKPKKKSKSPEQLVAQQRRLLSAINSEMLTAADRARLRTLSNRSARVVDAYIKLANR